MSVDTDKTCGNNSDHNRLDELEMKASFQEELLSQLNDVVTQQSLRLTTLERQIGLLLERANKTDDEDGRVSGNPLDEPPRPHYWRAARRVVQALNSRQRRHALS